MTTVEKQKEEIYMISKLVKSFNSIFLKNIEFLLSTVN